MASLSSTNTTVLDILNEELGSAFTDLTSAFRSYQAEQAMTAVGICGFPCVGDCSTCTTAEERLTAFFAPEADLSLPVEPLSVAPVVSEASATVEGTSSSSTEDETWEEQTRAARTLDEVDELRVTGIWADTGADYYDRADGRDDLSVGPSEADDYDPNDYYDERDDYDYDGGYDNGWNESGYNDF